MNWMKPSLLIHCHIPIDLHLPSSDNSSMSTTAPKSNVHELEEALARVMKGEHDPERMGKALEAAKLSREETREKVGHVLDVCVDLVREVRQ